MIGIELKFIWMDGSPVEFAKATVHILTPALHYGAAVYEGLGANISLFTRHRLNVAKTTAKMTGNYVNSSLAKTESERLGFLAVSMPDPVGCAAECIGMSEIDFRNIGAGRIGSKTRQIQDGYHEEAIRGNLPELNTGAGTSMDASH